MKKQIVFFIVYALFIFQVDAQSLSLPYYTGFDSLKELEGWKEFRLGATTYTFNWEIAECSICPSQPKCIYHHYNLEPASPTDTVEDWFVSPPLKVLTRAKISIKIYVPNLVFGDTFHHIKLFFSSGINDPAKSNFIELINLTKRKREWVDTFAYITTITDTGFVAFKYKGCNLPFEVLIDNVSIAPDTGASIFGNFRQNKTTILFPNPSNGIVTVILSENKEMKCDLVIYDMLGLKVYSQVLLSKRETIKLPLASGIYFYKVMNKNEEIAIGKLIFL